MFTTLETEENDVFSCDICDDIFVSEESIKKHIVEDHEEEDFEVSVPAKNANLKGQNNSEKENSRAKGQNEDKPWWLEDIFYVCDVCYEMFSNSPGLRNHQRLIHNMSQKKADTGETTEAKEDIEDKKLTVNTSILNTNSDTKLLKNKITKRSSSISKEETIQPTNVQEKTSTTIKRNSCFKCGLECKNLVHRKNHILSHYYSSFYKVLPTTNPYVCPQCGQTSRDRITLIRHFAFSHKKMYEFTGVTEDLLLLK